MRALDRKLWRDLVHWRSQFIAVAIVVASGVALFATLRSMNGYLVNAQQSYYAQGRFAQVFARFKQAPLNVARRVEMIPGVAAVEPRIVADVLLDVAGLEEPATGRLVSLPVGRGPGLNVPFLRRGRLPHPRSPREILVSDAFARANGLVPGSKLGAILHGRWQLFTVVGTAISPEFIYEIRGGADIFPDNRRFGALWMSYRPLAAAFDLEGSFNDLVLTLAPGASERDVIARLDRMLEPYGGVGAFGREDHISHRFVSDEIAETEVTSILLPTIFLLVTAFLLHLVILRLVATQREEIAVLRAFGYGKGAIAAHYLELALVPVAIGSLAGAALGYWFATGLAAVYARFFQFPKVKFSADPWLFLAAIAIAGGAALAGAFGAVRRAAALAPAEAMRPEAPARFHAGALERSGALHWVSPAARIVIRHLVRRPVRAILSSLAIAFAVAILVAGRFGFDAVDWMKQVQFGRVQREDVAVTFGEAQSPAALYELAHLPGVLRVEPFRSVPVRVSNAKAGDRVHRTELLGIEGNAELRRTVDADLRVHRPPRGGVMMGRALARILRVGPGDRVVIEVLEGLRPVPEATVAAVVDDLFGTSMTMELGALHRLLREGDTLSGGFLAVDPKGSADLYARLKRLPSVSGVGVRESALRGFERTIAESFTISITSLVLFAAVIASGMVYNGARIALSERGRELASLRVLGFYRAEVTKMLLGEQALLTLLAIAPGLALGYALCALMVLRFQSELFRIPLVVSVTTLAFATLTVAVAASLSALAVRRRIHRLDLIQVLKTRE
ncbi:MAG TPA: FtsX-like permease family protein [Thermoanaerobaculia bacterium]|nr:FtsX-like permease family protein [Thermoanaerobaculia bacterium]